MVRIIGRIGGFMVLFILLVWAVLLIACYGNVELQEFKAEHNTAYFLKAVQQQNYVEATKWFGSSLDLEELQTLQSMRLVKFSRLKAVFDDGCVCSGHAELTFQAEGPPITVPAVFTLRDGHKPGQICAMTSGQERAVMPQLGKWNKAICGSDSF
jgi:hypothetical protein